MSAMFSLPATFAQASVSRACSPAARRARPFCAPSNCSRPFAASALSPRGNSSRKAAERLDARLRRGIGPDQRLQLRARIALRAAAREAREVVAEIPGFCLSLMKSQFASSSALRISSGVSPASARSFAARSISAARASSSASRCLRASSTTAARSRCALALAFRVATPVLMPAQALASALKRSWGSPTALRATRDGFRQIVRGGQLAPPTSTGMTRLPDRARP